MSSRETTTPGEATADRREPAAGLDGVAALSDQAEALAHRLAQTGSTAALPHLTEMLDHYGDILAALEEADTAWLATLQRCLHASSD